MATIQVKLKNGEIVPMSHPDDWTSEQVENAIHENFPDDEKSDEPKSEIPESPFNDRPEPKPEKTGFAGLKDDAIQNLAQAIKGGIGFARDIPNKLEKHGKYIEEHPGSSILRNVGQLAAGAAELGKGFLNLPHTAIRELGRKDLIPEWLKKYNELPFTHIPENTGLEHALGLEANPEHGEDLIRAIPEITSLVAPIGGVVKAGRRALAAPSKEKLFQRALEEKIDKAAEKTAISEDQLKSLKDALKLEYSEQHPGSIGDISPVGQKVAINEKTRKIGELSENASKGEPGTIPAKPDVKAAEKSLANALESTRNHEKHGGRIYKKALEEDKTATSKLYDDYRADLRSKDLKVDNTAQIKDVSQKLNEMKDNDELAPGYGSGTEEQKALETQLKNLENETVNAEDVFALKRTLDHMADKTRDKQYSGVDDTEFKRLRLIAERLESKAGKLGKVLESVGSPETRNMLKMANKGWSKYSAAKNHPVGRKALKEGLLAPNTISKLESTGLGSEYLKSISAANPQLQKHILSQKYGKESQFKHLLEPKEEVEPYLANREDLHAHIEHLRETKHQEEQHASLVKSMKDAAEVKSLGQQIEFHHKAIPKIETKMKQIAVDSAEHKKLEKELKSHKNHIADKNHLLKKYSNVILKATGVSALLHKIGL